MKKTIAALILIFTLISIFAVSAFAETADASTVQKSSETGNIFDTVYTILLQNSDKVLSALAFASSLLIMLVYKRGLLPILKNALSSLGTSVSKLREESSQNLSLAAEKLGNAENVISALTERLSELEKKLKSAEELKSESERLSLIMSCQIDMLCDVFMSSSLPAYKKEAVANKISEMRSSLSPAGNEVSRNEKDVA